jgi:hypothetical protein
MTNKTNLKSDGERMIPAYHKGNIIYGEHMGRYYSILQLIKGKVVLDIASGSGYGSQLMAAQAVLVLSTPNDRVYPKGNHFHVKEHNKASLTALLKKHFRHVGIQYQVVSIAASVLSEDEVVDDAAANANWELHKVYGAKPDESIYYLAICSDSDLPKIRSNTLLAQEYSHLDQQRNAEHINSMNIEIQKRQLRQSFDRQEIMRSRRY